MPGQRYGNFSRISASIARSQDLQDGCSKPDELVGLLEPAKNLRSLHLAGCGPWKKSLEIDGRPSLYPSS